MKLRIVKHYNSENGSLKGYTLEYRPISFIPYWKEMKGLYESKQQIEHDVCWLMSLSGLVDYKERYD